MEVSWGFAGGLWTLTDADLCVHIEMHTAWPVEWVIKIWPVERTAHSDKEQGSQVVSLLQPAHTGQRAGAESSPCVTPGEAVAVVTVSAGSSRAVKYCHSNPSSFALTDYLDPLIYHVSFIS